jgi:50S ribosome-binding GTPase
VSADSAQDPAIDRPSAAIAIWSPLTPGSSRGAVAAIHLRGDIDTALRRLMPPTARPVRVGSIVLRPIAEVDTALIARWAVDSAQIMPHGGPLIARELAAAFERAGIAHDRSAGDACAAMPHETDRELRSRYPQAGNDIESRMLDALARAQSPRAVDLLLDQPRRWAAHLKPHRPHGTTDRFDGDAADTSNPTDRVREFEPIGSTGASRCEDEHRSRLLDRLIEPPLVVALGPSNIGKSTLINALAGRNVSIVADEPGTTRDHVGVMMEFDGLVVRYADTPGVRPDPRDADESEHAALKIAMELAARADLLLLCGDADRPPIEPLPFPPIAADHHRDGTDRRSSNSRETHDPSNAIPGSSAKSLSGLNSSPISRSVPSLRIALRVDRAGPSWSADILTSAVTGQGLPELALAIRRSLVPDDALADPRPWRFWR